MENQKISGVPSSKKHITPPKSQKIPKSNATANEEDNMIFSINKSYIEKEMARSHIQIESGKLLETFKINEKIIMELDLEKYETTGWNEKCKIVRNLQRYLCQEISAFNILHGERRQDFDTDNILELEKKIIENKARFMAKIDRQKKLLKKLQKQNDKNNENLNKNEAEELQRSFQDTLQELDYSYERFVNKSHACLELFFRVQLYNYMERQNVISQKMIIKLWKDREMLRNSFNVDVIRDLSVICDMQARVKYLMRGGSRGKVRNIKDMRKMKKQERYLNKELREEKGNLEFLQKKLNRFHRRVEQMHNTQEWCKLKRKKNYKMQEDMISPLFLQSEMDKQTALKKFEELENISERNDGDSLKQNVERIKRKIQALIQQTNILLNYKDAFADSLLLKMLFERYKIRMDLKNKRMMQLENILNRLLTISKKEEDFFHELNREDDPSTTDSKNLYTIYFRHKSHLEEQINYPGTSESDDEFVDQDTLMLKIDGQSNEIEDALDTTRLRHKDFVLAYERLTESSSTDLNIPIQKFHRFERK